MDYSKNRIANKSYIKIESLLLKKKDENAEKPRAGTD